MTSLFDNVEKPKLTIIPIHTDNEDWLIKLFEAENRLIEMENDPEFKPAVYGSWKKDK